MRKCRVCKSFRLKKVFSLGKQPLANQFKKSTEESKEYPLDLYQCQHCTLLQLGHIVPKEEMYDEYFYVPSVSKTGLKHFKDLSQKLCKILNLKKGSLVVDVGSNDGSFLECFLNKVMTVLGVEPAQNIKTKVATMSAYFNEESAGGIVHMLGKARL